MSTILKALRRLEDDSKSPRPDSLSATDPAAADELRSRILAGQGTEVRVAVNVLNRMLELGSPRSEPIHN